MSAAIYRQLKEAERMRFSPVTNREKGRHMVNIRKRMMALVLAGVTMFSNVCPQTVYAEAVTEAEENVQEAATSPSENVEAQAVDESSNSGSQEENSSEKAETEAKKADDQKKEADASEPEKGEIALKVTTPGGRITVKDSSGSVVAQMQDDGQVAITNAQGSISLSTADKGSYSLLLSEEMGSLVTFTAESMEGYELSSYSVTSAAGMETRAALEEHATTYTGSVTVSQGRQVVQTGFAKKAETVNEDTTEENASEELSSGDNAHAEDNSEEEADDSDEDAEAISEVVEEAAGNEETAEEMENVAEEATEAEVTAVEETADLEEVSKDKKVLLSGEHMGIKWIICDDDYMYMSNGYTEHLEYPNPDANDTGASLNEVHVSNDTWEEEEVAASMMLMAAAARPSTVPASFSGSCTVQWTHSVNDGYPSTTFGVGGWTGKPAASSTSMGTITLSCADHSAAPPAPGTSCTYKATFQSWNASTGVATYSLYCTPPGATDGVTRNEHGLVGYQHMSGTVSLTFKTNGKVSVRKTSADKSAPIGNGHYSYSGCTYGVYAEKACTTLKATLKVNATTGISNKAELSAGTYYIKEITAGKGMKLSNKVYKVKLESDKTEQVAVEDPIVYTKINLQKSIKGMTDTAGYDLAGAVYGVFKDKNCTSKVTQITTDSTGYGESEQVLYINETYYVKETAVPKAGGFGQDQTVYTVKTVAPGKVKKGAPQVISQESLLFGGVEIYKYDVFTGGLVPQGNAKLEGTVLEIVSRNDRPVLVGGKSYTNGQVVKTIVTNDKGYAATGKEDLPFGNYTIREVTSPTGYLLSGKLSQDFTVDAQGVLKNLTEFTVAIHDEPVRGGVSILKIDGTLRESEPQGDGSLAGAMMAIVNKSINPVKVGDGLFQPGEIVMNITTNEQGIASTSNTDLPYGTYEIHEVSPSTGYLLNNEWTKTFDITENGVIVSLAADPVPEPEVRGGVGIQKVTGDTGEAVPEGDATLAGARFAITNKSAHLVVVDGSRYQAGNVVMTIETDEKGYAATGNRDLVFGTYELHEIEPSTGYLLNNEWTQTFSIRNDGEIVDLTPQPVKEPVIRGGVSVQKLDKDWMTNDPEGDATLAGAKFAITNQSQHSVVVDAKTLEVGAVVKTIETDDKGYAATGNRDLPYGTYEIHEVDPSTGYLLNKEWSEKFEIRKDGEMVDLTPKTVPEPVIRGGVKMQKMDKELHKAEALGGASLAGIEFQIVNHSQHAVHVNGADYEPDAVVMRIHTNADGIAQTAGNVLPYGTYSIQEMPSDDLKISANDSYLLTDGNQYIFQIREDGKIVDFTKDGTPLEVEDQVKRNNISFRKVEDRSDRSMGLIPFVIENTTTHEKHVVVVDKNGKYSSSKYAHSRSTNALDGLLEKYGKDDVIPTTELDYKFGTWFGLGQSGSMAAVDDSLKAFPYGEYTLTELRCENNEGYELIENYVFTIEEDTSEVDGESIDLYNLHNIPLPVEIQTKALDDATGEHISLANDDIHITDTVSCKNLTKGQKYVLKAELMDAESGTAVKGSAGSFVKGEQAFTADNSSMDVPVSLTFDGTQLAGKSLVVYEVLYRVEANGTQVKAAEHKEIDDPDQTVVLPKIGTTAVDGQTGSSVGAVTETTTIIDQVTYANLVPGKAYKVSGSLMDQETGKVLVVDGKEIRNELTFTPEESDGMVEMTFTFSSMGLGGKSVVAFETVTLNGKTIGVHADIHDEGQTISYVDAKTTAKDGTTGEKTGAVSTQATVVDTVQFKGLVIGKEYTVTGTLMNKETKEPLKDQDGNAITVSRTFTAQQKNGSIDLTFELDSTLLAGKQIVAFETVDYEGIQVAVHADIEDQDQTIWYPEIHTNAMDEETKDHIALAKDKAVFVDTVSYINLQPETAYTMKGILMDGVTGQPVMIDGSQVTGETTFTTGRAKGYDPVVSGSVEVIFQLDASKIAGTKTVVFEKLLRGDTEIASHEDVKDKDQMITVPEIHTTATDAATKTHTGTVSAKTVIRDVVSFSKLISGKQYTVKGQLVNKATGKPIKGAVAEQTFIAKETDETITLEFTVDSTQLKGTSVVAFEHVYYGEIEVAIHADLSDEDQTVHFPEIGTTATDKATGSHSGALGERTVIQDEVAYKALTVGATYTLKGCLMNKETGKALEGAEVTKTFTAETADGIVVMEFNLNTSALAGVTTVVFEKLFEGEVEITAHEDLNDEGQSVHFPSLKTSATANGKNEVKAQKKITVVDKVTYTNLVVGEEYTVKGTLMNKKTGTAVKNNGKTVTAETTFTAKKKDGSVKVTFTFDGTNLGDETLVVFESLYHGKVKMAVHEDLQDKAQTVKITKPEEPETPETPGKSVPPTPDHPKTGDETNLTFYLSMMLLAGIAAVIMRRKFRRS